MLRLVIGYFRFVLNYFRLLFILIHQRKEQIMELVQLLKYR
jgi:hypothetical protein